MQNKPVIKKTFKWITDTRVRQEIKQLRLERIIARLTGEAYEWDHLLSLYEQAAKERGIEVK